MLPIKIIQKWMAENKKDIFIINRTDEFLGEYIAPYAERLKWISNFSGSAGRAIIETNKAFIFTDGRYTNQIKDEVDINHFEIKHLSNYWKHLQNYRKKNKFLILDTNLHSIKEVEKMQSIFKNTNIELEFLKKNPIDINWKNKPSFPNSLAFIQPEKYAGQSSINKIKNIQNILKSKFINFYLLTSLDSIAWLLNIRGSDIDFTPLLSCYVIIPQDGKIELFVDINKIKSVKSELKSTVNFHSFTSITKFIINTNSKNIIGFDDDEVPYYFKKVCINAGLITNYINNPCVYPKAKKNAVELEGARKANLRDGVSMTKFLFWLKKKIKIDQVDEIIASNYLYSLRKKNKLFHSPSFDTISAFGFHAALPHYRVNIKSNLSFKDNGIYLVDSGAQYKDGTTDITRTIILGKPTSEHKDRFTRVLKGHIAISKAQFKIKTKGSELDPLARESLNEIECDYDHGTGHGIGSFLSVHEGPQRIARSKNKNDAILETGMILSNEPGYYKEGEYGIRIENLIICKFKNKNYLCFENITWAPIDIDLINVSLLNNIEIKWINNYHYQVYENISPNLLSKEREWLFEVTRSLKK